MSDSAVFVFTAAVHFVGSFVVLTLTTPVNCSCDTDAGHFSCLHIATVSMFYHVFIIFLSLCRRLFQPQQNLLTVPEAQVSPLRDTPNSSPAHRPKPSLPEEYTDPLASKKPRISHLSSKAAGDKSRVRPSKQAAHEDTRTGNDGNSLDPRRLFDSLSAVCQREAEVAKRLEPAPCVQEEPKATADLPQPKSDGSPSPLMVPDQNRHTIKRKKSKHKHADQVRKLLFIWSMFFFHLMWCVGNWDLFLLVQEKERWRDRKERRKDHSPEDPKKVSLDCTGERCERC